MKHWLMNILRGSAFDYWWGLSSYRLLSNDFQWIVIVIVWWTKMWSWVMVIHSLHLLNYGHHLFNVWRPAASTNLKVHTLDIYRGNMCVFGIYCTVFPQNLANRVLVANYRLRKRNITCTEVIVLADHAGGYKDAIWVLSGTIQKCPNSKRINPRLETCPFSTSRRKLAIICYWLYVWLWYGGSKVRNHYRTKWSWCLRWLSLLFRKTPGKNSQRIHLQYDSVHEMHDSPLWEINENDVIPFFPL